MDQFDENKFYVLSGQGINWSDYDGPFDTIDDVCDRLRILAGGEYASPELINGTVIVQFRDSQLHLVKDDNGNPINGATMHFGNSICYQGRVIQ